MNKLQKLISLLLCLCMLMGVAALAEEATVEAEASAVIEIPAETVVVTLNGEAIAWADVEVAYNTLVAQYANYYDMSQQANIDLFRAVAMENKIVEKLLGQKAVEFGLTDLSAEEVAELEAAAEADWASAIDNYIAYFHADLTEESTEEEKAEAQKEAEAYYNDAGFSPESLREEYKLYSVMGKVQDLMVQDAVVTDEDVEAHYQALVAQDQELYANDIAAYVEYNSYVDQMAMYAMMSGSASDMDYAWYRPDGFRAVKHILLPVDETLMAAYTDLQARLEEQASAEAEEAAEETTEEAAEETSEGTVNEAMVNEAKAAIFASLADKIDEINQKVAEGVDFDELIATYGVDAEGNPSDPGMANEPTKTTGYEVSAASSNYVPEFVEASMSIEEVGGVSAPYLSDFGIHIVKYIADIPGGPVEMTEAQRENMRAQLLNEKQNELYTTTIEKWLADSVIEYAGVVPSLAELEAAQAADAAAE